MVLRLSEPPKVSPFSSPHDYPAAGHKCGIPDFLGSRFYVTGTTTMILLQVELSSAFIQCFSSLCRRALSIFDLGSVAIATHTN